MLDPAGDATLSRVVDDVELARNTSRIPAYGFCGYLALQRVAEGAGFVESWSDLHTEVNRERLVRFLDRLLCGCTDGRTRRKMELVQTSLKYASHPWRLGRDSGGWLDIGDLAHLNVDFPLLVWGSDMGDGHRRVQYPAAGNGPITSVAAGLLSRSEGQIILDSGHFFPLDNVTGEGAEAVFAAVCGDDVVLGGTGRGIQSVGSALVPGPSLGAYGGVERDAGERGSVEADVVRRKRSSGNLRSDAGEQEDHHGSRGGKEARTELEPVADAISQEDVWGCDRPD